MQQAAPEITLTAQPDDPLPIGKAALLGLQHVLAMDVYIVPFIIASVLAFSVSDAASFIQSAFVAAGIATLVHTPRPMRFLNRVCRRPEGEKALMLIVAGHPAAEAMIPAAGSMKKPLEEISSWL